MEKKRIKILYLATVIQVTLAKRLKDQVFLYLIKNNSLNKETRASKIHYLEIIIKEHIYLEVEIQVL